MATTTITSTTCDQCSKEKSEKNVKDWIGGVLLLGVIPPQGPGIRPKCGVYFGDPSAVDHGQGADSENLDFCSPICAFKYTVSLLKWKTVGRPAGSRNRRKVEVAAV